ncbi:hypothetical protein HYT17_02520 [Candidatus Microgenomates bacterium]|nr:hypothetical protein [Candidatus Microgenomates bacterium]
MNTLLIDTADNEEIKVGLRINRKEYWLKRVIDYRKAQVVLPMIDSMLKKHNLQPTEIEKIEVNQGPGSFTGIRVGLSVANALRFALGI